MWELVTRICSGVVALGGAVYIVQGLRAGRGSADGRLKALHGLFLILMVGSGVLPESLGAVRAGMVVAGCLLLLASIFVRSPPVTPPNSPS